VLSVPPEASRLRNRPSPSESEQLAVVQAPVAVGETHLVEREPRLHADRECAWDDLEVELPVVAGRDLIEAVVAIGEHAREHVEPSRRALRIGLGPHVLGQAQLLNQRDQVGPVALERGTVAEVDLFEGEILDLLLDRRVAVRQEAAAQRPRALAQAQVDARRLHRLPRDAPRPGHDPLLGDRLAQALCRQDAAIGALGGRAHGGGTSLLGHRRESLWTRGGELIAPAARRCAALPEDAEVKWETHLANPNIWK
jgi:hypothetical protein